MTSGSIGQYYNVETDPRETAFLFQRLPVAVQRFNAACLADTFTISESAQFPDMFHFFLNNLQPSGMSTLGIKMNE